MSHIEGERSFIPVRIAVVTVSDTRTLDDDKSGDTLAQRIEGAVLANGTYLFALPGSTGACKDAWDDILLHQFDARTRPCNMVELIPRLNEHLK